MRKSVLMAMIMAAIPSVMSGETLEPTGCSISDRPFVYPLECVQFTFDRGVEINSGAGASVRCGEEIIATTFDLEASNYTSAKGTQGTVIVWFPSINLPLGKEYVFELFPASVTAKDSPQTLTGLISVPLVVPADLGEPTFDIEQNSVVESARSMWVYWETETEAVGEPVWTLYREGEIQGTYPAHVGWDWDLGQAYADFGEKIYFDRDVHYSLVLPEGSVRSIYRDDILSREVRLDFIGGYVAPPAEPIAYEWCSLFDGGLPEVLGEVWFRYSEPIIVADDAKVLLYEYDPLILVAEADAWLDTSVNCFLMRADFGGYQINPDKAYILVIPEGAVLSSEGEPVPRQSLTLNSGSGIEAVGAEESPAPFFDLSGQRVETPQPGRIYITQGKKILGR